MISISIVVGIVRIHGTTGGWTVWALSRDQGIEHVFNARGGSFDVSYPHVGMHITGCPTLPIGCDKFVICWASIFIQIGGSRGRHTVWAGELVSTCKVFDFWLCNPWVSGGGDSEPVRPSDMPQECIWITAMEEGCSERGDSIPDISILGTHAIDDQLASEEVVWTLFLRVRVHIRLLGVTVESISVGEIGTRHWMGEQGAVAVVSPEKHLHGNLQRLLPARRDT